MNAFDRISESTQNAQSSKAICRFRYGGLPHLVREPPIVGMVLGSLFWILVSLQKFDVEFLGLQKVLTAIQHLLSHANGVLQIVSRCHALVIP